MNKKQLFTLIMLSCVSNYSLSDNNSENKPENTPVQTNQENEFVTKVTKLQEQFDALFDEEIEHMRQLNDSFYKDFFNSNTHLGNSDFKNIKSINITNEVDKDGKKWIIITVELPDANAKYNNIQIKAKANNLDCSLEFADHKVKFFVIRGREFGTSVEYIQETKQDKADNKEKFERVVSASSTQMSSIPKVTDLENAKANLENGKLIIKLPALMDSRQNWTAINVNVSDSQNNTK